MTSKTNTTNHFTNIRLALRLRTWEFAPSLVPTLAVIILLPILIYLGVWQLHRAVAKQQLIDQLTTRSVQKPQQLDQANLPLPQYTALQVNGHFDQHHIILMDNRIFNHQVGYDVLVPFLVSGGRRMLLVNLGWISKMNCQKKELQDLSCPVIEDFFKRNSFNLINGLVHYPEHNLVLAHNYAPVNWPYLAEDVRLPEFSKVLNATFYPFILLSTDTEGFYHHWDIVTSITPARHRGYAVQWFALALTLIILYLKLNLQRKNCRSSL